ncbi:MAG: Serine--tRNA ligase [Planctomycetes bacterium ADurb.Bin126]|nr:MAG: Serine--tRNA ligase [Planctomycetes bacterium ADurb.Bin126]HOD82752.1 serine--tRNA ligase [Phycisphaerae bacterium]HQL73387.1 serine--tRNA ligase [Phycisphaerae bacterium]
MIDIRLIRAEPQKFIDAARNKNIKVDIPALLEVDSQILDAQRELQDARTAQNAAGKKIAKLTGDDKATAIAEMAQFKTRAKELGDLIDRLQPKFDELMLLVAQPAAAEVPLGKDDTENVVLRVEGQVPTFDFEPKDHVQLGEALDIIDIPRGVKLAGSRNFILKGAGAMLHQAILRLALDQMTAKGFTLMTVPVLVKESVMYGTGYFPVGRDQAYLAERDQMSLVGTAEVPVTAYHTDEVLSFEDLPRKYVALSTCFRREAGAAGKDTYGLYRIHYFDKVEQVILCRNDEQTSIAHHQEILRNAEDVLRALELPYRVVNVCTGDLGQGQIQKYDIETWMPSRNGYGETHSASRFHEFQARRLNIRYRDESGRMHYVHTLNNTVIASPRVLVPVLELYQNADGSVTIPKALRPYMNGMERIEKRA